MGSIHIGNDSSFEFHGGSQVSSINGEVSINDGKFLNVLGLADGFGIGFLDSFFDFLFDEGTIFEFLDGFGCGSCFKDVGHGFI